MNDATPPTPKRSQIICGIVILLGINVILPIVLYNVLSPHMNEVYAILLSGIPPMAETIYHIAVDRSFDVMNVIAVISIIVSVTMTLASMDYRLGMVKDSIFTFLFGICYWLSLFWWKENLIFYYYRRMSGPSAKEYMDRLYTHPRMRYFTAIMCRVWGTCFILEAVVRVILIYTLPLEAMIYVSPVLVWGVLVGLSVWNHLYVRSIKKKYGELRWDLIEPRQPEVETITNDSQSVESYHSIEDVNQSSLKV